MKFYDHMVFIKESLLLLRLHFILTKIVIVFLVLMKDINLLFFLEHANNPALNALALMESNLFPAISRAYL